MSNPDAALYHSVNKCRDDEIPVSKFCLVDICVILILCGGFFYAIGHIDRVTEKEVMIYSDSKIYGRYSLSENRHLSIPGSIGTMELEISGEKAWVSSSPCKNQICRKNGSIHLSYQQIVCVPNHIIVEIRSDRDTDIPDGLTK